MMQSQTPSVELYIDRVGFNEEIRNENIYIKKDNNNPDKELYASSEDGYKLKPRQCPGCQKIFTPKYDIQEKCEDCVEIKKKAYVNPALIECEESDCNVTFVRTGNRQKKCQTKPCLARRDQRARDKYKKNSRPIPHLCPHCHKHINVTLKAY